MDAKRYWTVFILLVLPMAAAAEDLELGVNFGGGYDSNVYTTSDGEQDDYVLRIQPEVRVKDTDGDFRWDLGYEPSYEYFIQTSGKRNWTHQANGSLTWQFHPTTRLQLSDRFGRYDSPTRFNEAIAIDAGDEIVDVTTTGFRSDRNTRNNFSAMLIHDLSPTQMLVLDLGHSLIDYSREERADRETLSAMGRYEQTVSRRTRLGGGVSYRRASLDSTSLRGSQSTDFYNLFGSWRYIFDNTLQLSVAAGPTWIKGDDQDNLVGIRGQSLLYPLLNTEGGRRLVKATSCPALGDGTRFLGAGCEPIDTSLTFNEVNALIATRTDLSLFGPIPSGNNDTVTYFANISLQKRWEYWSGVLSYRRQQSDSSGIGSSTIADIVSGALTWKPSERWSASLHVSWTRQSSAVEGVQTVVAVTPVNLESRETGLVYVGAAQAFGLRAIKVDQDQDVDTTSVSLSGGYQLTKRASLFGRALYWYQTSDSVVGNDYDRYRIEFGVNFNFEPIQL